MNYDVNDIIAALNSQATIADGHAVIDQLLTDSRKVYNSSSALFFALKGPRRDGHVFINDLYKKGIRNFVVEKIDDPSIYPGANFYKVKNTVTALQQIAAYHRKQFDIPVIGITGSNGKTIVKEWLHQLLQHDQKIVRSPRSYNSQIGVPLSVWQMEKINTLAIFEAGISMPGEMKNLQAIIQPTIGVLTNIRDAHGENFSSKEDKLKEKLQLFSNAKIIIANGDDVVVTNAIKNLNTTTFLWGTATGCELQIQSVKKENASSIINAVYQNQPFSFTIPFTDDASVENAITCCAVLLVLKTNTAVITERMQWLQPVNMRLELKKGINHCSIINDSYSADISSLKITLHFLAQQSAGTKKTVILSDFLQTGMTDAVLYKEIEDLLILHKIDRLVGIGHAITNYFSAAEKFKGQKEFYNSADELISHFVSATFKEETILIKGARVFGFEKIVHLLEQKVHQTILEIDLNAIVHNLKTYQKLLQPTTKTMAMVKAFAYGSGGAEIAGVLQYHKTDYLGVAYADEGVELRRAGINMPVMVLNTEASSFDALLEYNLEPVIFSLDILKEFEIFLQQNAIQNFPVHIEIETGMNRLGFPLEQVQQLAAQLLQSSSFRVQSVFSHLAASEDAGEDNFTQKQYDTLLAATTILEKEIGYSFLKHIANSAAILRHPYLQMDMVRLGIGLYGVDSAASHSLDLIPAATLKSTVAQIKNLQPGETVSYNRKAVIDKPTTIATVRIGYADGYLRKFGYGKGYMMINGQKAPVVGTVCMDMTMVDITNIPAVKEGDEVEIFGKQIAIEELASWAGTIPYEIMTGISQRVKRVYFEEQQ